jgi:peptidoglycan hydrolase-like protein with peptidoglycan-binding domain
MRTTEHWIWAFLLCVLLSCLYSCGSNDGPDAYTQSLQNNSSNLNMKGEPLQKTSPENIARLQADLQYLGYYPGQVDGTYNPKTRLAIKRFQEKHGLHTDGMAGTLTEQAILKAIHARTALQNNTPSSIQSQQISNP